MIFESKMLLEIKLKSWSHCLNSCAMTVEDCWYSGLFMTEIITPGPPLYLASPENVKSWGWCFVIVELHSALHQTRLCHEASQVTEIETLSPHCTGLGSLHFVRDNFCKLPGFFWNTKYSVLAKIGVTFHMIVLIRVTDTHLPPMCLKS